MGGIVLLGVLSQAQAEEYSKSYSVSGRPTVHVTVDDSRVRIVTVDTKQVAFNVSREGPLDPLKIDSHQDGDRVEISVLHKPGVQINNTERHLTTVVHLPRDADLRVEATDGAITASQLTGKIELESVDGAIHADALKGDVRLHSIDGAIELTQFDGHCDVSSTDGALRAEGRFDSLRLVTTDGSVVAKVADGSKMTSAWQIRTVDGSVDVSLPHDFQANIDASTQDGRIKLAAPVTVQGEISKSRVRGTLNGGGPELTLKSTDGSIRISN
jgi:hypothetical protein